MLCLDKVENAIHAVLQPVYVNHHITLNHIHLIHHNHTEKLPLDIIRVIMSLWYDINDDVQNLHHDYIEMMRFNIFAIKFIALIELRTFCQIFSDIDMDSKFNIFAANVMKKCQLSLQPNLVQNDAIDTLDTLEKIDNELFEKLIHLPSTYQNLRRCWHFLDKHIGQQVYINSLAHKAPKLLTKECYLFYM